MGRFRRQAPCWRETAPCSFTARATSPASGAIASLAGSTMAAPCAWPWGVQRSAGSEASMRPTSRLTTRTPTCVCESRLPGWRGCTRLARGVEIMPAADARWLAGRLFHYDVLVRARRLPGGLSKAVDRTQPQAALLSLEELGATRSPELVPALAAAGIAPPEE